LMSNDRSFLTHLLTAALFFCLLKRIIPTVFNPHRL
jgi:hypothetical protein